MNRKRETVAWRPGSNEEWAEFIDQCALCAHGPTGVCPIAFAASEYGIGELFYPKTFVVCDTTDTDGSTARCVAFEEVDGD